MPIRLDGSADQCVEVSRDANAAPKLATTLVKAASPFCSLGFFFYGTAAMPCWKLNHDICSGKSRHGGIHRTQQVPEALPARASHGNENSNISSRVSSTAVKMHFTNF